MTDIDKAPIGTLICDPPSQRMALLSMPGPIDPVVLNRIRDQWNESMRTGKVLIIDNRIKVDWIEAGPGGWPDWEHNAA